MCGNWTGRAGLNGTEGKTEERGKEQLRGEIGSRWSSPGATPTRQAGKAETISADQKKDQSKPELEECPDETLLEALRALLWGPACRRSGGELHRQAQAGDLGEDTAELPLPGCQHRAGLGPGAIGTCADGAGKPGQYRQCEKGSEVPGDPGDKAWRELGIRHSILIITRCGAKSTGSAE